MPDTSPAMTDSIPLKRQSVRHRIGTVSVMPPECCPPSLRNHVRHEPAHAQISMDGKGRWIDNAFVERVWRSVKYENIYLRAYENGTQLRRGLTEYFDFYNTRRAHQALDYQTPDDMYYGRVASKLAA